MGVGATGVALACQAGCDNTAAVTGITLGTPTGNTAHGSQNGGTTTCTTANNTPNATNPFCDNGAWKEAVGATGVALACQADCDNTAAVTGITLGTTAGFTAHGTQNGNATACTTATDSPNTTNPFCDNGAWKTVGGVTLACMTRCTANPSTTTFPNTGTFTGCTAVAHNATCATVCTSGYTSVSSTTCNNGTYIGTSLGRCGTGSADPTPVASAFRHAPAAGALLGLLALMV